MNEKVQKILSPRPNPEIRPLVRTMEKTWKELRAEKGYSQRKGQAAVFSALIDQLMEAGGFELSDRRDGPLAILIDPAGTTARTPYSGFLVARGNDETLLGRAADFLSQCLDIRFLAANVRVSHSTH